MFCVINFFYLENMCLKTQSYIQISETVRDTNAHCFMSKIPDMVFSWIILSSYLMVVDYYLTWPHCLDQLVGEKGSHPLRCTRQCSSTISAALGTRSTVHKPSQGALRKSKVGSWIGLKFFYYMYIYLKRKFTIAVRVFFFF